MRLELKPKIVPVSLVLRFGNLVTGDVFGDGGSSHVVGFDVPAKAETPRGDEVIVAATDIGGHRVVIQDASGLCQYADIENVDHSGKIIGVTISSAIQGYPVTINKSGVVVENSWNWVPGGDIWLGANALPVQDVPINAAFLQRIGYAVSTNSMRVSIDDSVILGE